MTITSEAPPTPIVDPAERAFLRALGKRIRIQRITIELSQEQLAHAAGLSRNLVSSIERGRHGVDLVRLARLALALDASLPELLPDLAVITSGEQPPVRRSA
jgi:transcriptional regulator with XRE-family HTH domain